MILISHRGNLTGPNPEMENNPDYIKEALHSGYDVELDVWLSKGKLLMGHDEPQYEISRRFLTAYRNRLWIHCKNVEIFVEFKKMDHEGEKLNYFWHQEDTLALTSQGFIWAYPGKQPIEGSIAVMPEVYNDNLAKVIGVCSDYVKNYKK